MRLYIDRTFGDMDGLASKFPNIAVAWDRDGISEILSKIEPDMNQQEGLPRIYTNSPPGIDPDRVGQVSLYYGAYYQEVARYNTYTEKWDITLVKVNASV